LKIYREETPDFWLQYNLGTGYCQQKLYSEAIQHYLYALKLNPKDGQNSLNLGMVHDTIKDFENTTSYLIKANEFFDQLNSTALNK
jgi:tetratricopeptide (TPR) repeat protein